MHARARLHRRIGPHGPHRRRHGRVLPALLISGTIGLAASGAVEAQTVLPWATRLPASTRAMALGDSYQPGSGHADAVFYHPALLSRASGFGLDWQRWSSESSAAAASAAVSWFGGRVGIGLRSLQYSLSTRDDPLVSPDVQDPLFQVAATPVSERIATVGYSREVVLDLDVGVTVDLVDQRVGTQQHGVMLFDVGVSRELGDIIVALSAQDIGNKPIVDSGAEPASYTLGVGNYGRAVGPLDVGFAAHLGLDQDEQLSYGGGVEVGYWPIQGRTFVARLGFQDVPDDSEARPFTVGLAFWGDDLTLEWAFRPFDGADESGTHRFGLRWR